MHFFHWKLLYFDSIFTEICPHGPNWQYGSFGSDNGIVPKRRQAIIWINDDPVYGLGLIKLMLKMEEINFSFSYLALASFIQGVFTRLDKNFLRNSMQMEISFKSASNYVA